MTIAQDDTPGHSTAKHWGPERTVTVHRDTNHSLGISIVGGQVELSWSNSFVNGIFIKNVLPNSPAGKTGLLKTGDRILSVEGKDLRGASHAYAVSVIQACGDPVAFTVQSLVRWTPASSDNGSRAPSRLGPRPPSPVGPLSRSPSPELIQAGLSESEKKEAHQREAMVRERHLAASSRDSQERTEDASDRHTDSDTEEDERLEQGKKTSKGGVEIDRASAAALRRRPSDPQQEDKFGYTASKLRRKYRGVEGEIVEARLHRGPGTGLGISLAGKRDRTVMGVYVCGLNPAGVASRQGGVEVGDEVMEVNGVVVRGRCHLNATSVFAEVAGSEVVLVLRRSPTGLQEMAVKEVTQFPVSLNEQGLEEKFAKFKGVTNIKVKKGSGGLGIMILEGKHAEYGKGIFVSDLQEGSSAALAGLLVGDMILSVNREELLGIDYDSATKLLRTSEGVLDFWVANPARVKSSPEPSGEGVASPPAPLSSPNTPQPPTPATPSTPAPAPVKKKEPANPATAAVEHGQETTIEISKERLGLGLSIVGGKDTLLGAILIHEVYTDGAAAQDGRLRPGDQILEVSGQCFRAVTHQRALAVLRQTPAKVRMVVYREEPAAGALEVFTVALSKRAGRGLGLSIVGRKPGPGGAAGGVHISDLVAGGVAMQDGRLMQGDHILEVNGQDVRAASQEEAAAVLKCAGGQVTLKLGRLRIQRTSTDRPTRPVAPPPPSPHTPTEPPPAAYLPPPHAAPAYLPPGPTTLTVTLERGADGLGFSIVGGHGSNLGDLPIYVKKVFERGSAAREGTLRRGDQLVSVNGRSLRALTHAQAVAVLKEAQGTVAIQLLQNRAP